MLKVENKILAKASAVLSSAYPNFSGDGLSLSFSPEIKFGDFALPCFLLAKEFKTSPMEVAATIAATLFGDDYFVKVEAAGPYVNFTVKPEFLFEDLMNLDQTDCVLSAGERIILEYLSPNTNKPLHLGHVRNGCLGMAMANILAYTGYDVTRASLVNDRGIHICKSMLAWQKFGNGETPESTGEKGDHFVGRYYVKFAQESDNDPKLIEEAQAMLQKWEARDPEILSLWHTMNTWVYSGFEKTYKTLGFNFDKFYYESELYNLGKDIVADGLKAGVLKKEADGSIAFPLPVDKFGLDQDDNEKRVTLLRGDGTSVYITQDLGVAHKRFVEEKFSQAVYVVGSEQIYHFKCLIEVLAALGFAWAKNIRHLSYGMVYLPEGKMKSREGKVIDADNLAAELIDLAKAAVLERNSDASIDNAEIALRASKIGLGALKFFILRVGADVDIHFNPKESISFDGVTGPYCQYAFARINSILHKASDFDLAQADLSLLGNLEERFLAQKILALPRKIKEAATTSNPSLVAGGVYEIAKAFNQFYHHHQILGEEDKNLSLARLALIKKTADTIKSGLNLLGVETLAIM
ncbi:MAG: arginine--tRNA ligase [Candidatus Falkowbacteria bacterium]